MEKLVNILICILIEFICIGQDNAVKPYKILKGHPYKIMYLEYSSDGKYLASCGWDNTIRIWDMNNFSELKVLKGHSDVVWTSVFSNNGEYLVSGSRDASYILWDLKSGKIIKRVNDFPPKAKLILDKPDAPDVKWPNSVHGLAFSNNDKLLAAGCAEGKIRIYETGTLKLLHTLEGHKGIVIAIRFSKKRDWMLSSGVANEIIVWNTKTFKPLHIIKSKNVYIFQFFDNEKYLLNAGACTVEIYKTSNWKKIRSIPVQCGIQNAQLFAGGKYMAICGEDHTARLYDFKTGKEIWCYSNPKPEVGFCSISADENYFAVGIPEGDILVWKIKDLINSKFN